MAIYESKFIIGVTDICKNREIKNKAILRMFQDIAGMQSDKVHFGINDIDRTKLSWIILNWKIQVLKRPIYNDKVIIKTWIRDANKVFLYRDFEMCDNLGNILAIGTSKWAFINIDTKELTSIPKDVINAYEEEEKSVFEKRIIPKLKEASNYISKVDYKILRRDIDVNEHVHNLNYLDIAYEALPYAMYNQTECNNLEILFKKQIKFNDKIIAAYAKEKNENIIAIKSEDEETLHAIIKLF